MENDEGDGLCLRIKVKKKKKIPPIYPAAVGLLGGDVLNKLR